MSLARELAGLLEREHEACLLLAAVLEEENGALKRWDAGRIDALLPEKGGLFARIAACGVEARVLLARIATERGVVAEGGLTVGALVRMEGDSHEGRRLSEAREKLLTGAARVAGLNGANRGLVANALGMTRGCVRRLNALCGGSAQTYRPGGEGEEGLRPGLLLRRSY